MIKIWEYQHIITTALQLIIDGQIISDSEERFTRIKHDNSFPENQFNIL